MYAQQLKKTFIYGEDALLVKIRVNKRRNRDQNWLAPRERKAWREEGSGRGPHIAMTKILRTLTKIWRKYENFKLVIEIQWEIYFA